MTEKDIIITYFSLNAKEREEHFLSSSSLSFLQQGKVAVGNAHFAVLRENGTVSAYGDNTYGQCNVAGWRNVVRIAAGENHTAALMADGTVAAVGDNRYGQCNVADWLNVAELFADKNFTVAVTKQGRVLATKAAIPAEKKSRPKPEPDYVSLYEFHILEKSSIMIDKYLGHEETVTVPETIKGYPVTVIGEAAFENAKMRRLIFQPALQKICSYAFAFCVNLESVSFSEGLMSIEAYAFECCTSLTYVELPESIVRVGDWPFFGCTMLTQIAIPKKLSRKKDFLGGSSANIIIR